MPNTQNNIIKSANDLAECSSYITAVTTTNYFLTGMSLGAIYKKNEKIKMPYCVPDNKKVINNIKLVVKYINENPSTLSEVATIVIGVLWRNLQKWSVFKNFGYRFSC
ncbi:MAG: hypothetical protein KIT56_10095 [Gammaproteobacteria bacterium]|nr:hypothetical protein [Gammaproteobacteria bacterium]MCW5584200.1 hypothetical protein [Gammaproteobacteria bacterium]